MNDRIRVNHDDNLPYGFKINSEHKDNKVRWIHSKNTIHYPSAHITNKVFSNKELKSPLDKEQAMLQGLFLTILKMLIHILKPIKIYYQIQQLN